MSTITETFRARVTPEWLRTLDDWRRKQPDLPNRTEAMRRLVALGMRATDEGMDIEQRARSGR
jgi:hypothetical protein